MMFRVEHRNQGFNISIGDGQPAFALDVAAIHLALDHYYGNTHWQVPDTSCPFCVQTMAWVRDPNAKRDKATPVKMRETCGCPLGRCVCAEEAP